MDPHRFDLLVRSLSIAHPRRGFLAWLAALPLLGGLLRLLAPEAAEAGGRRKRRKTRHKRRRSKRERSRQRSRRQTQRKRKKRPKGCAAQPPAVTCHDTCGTVRNNCNELVDCGECPGEPQSCTSNADCSGDAWFCCGSPGTCINPLTDPQHCGDCNIACAPDQSCHEGQCTCGDVCGEGCQFQSVEEAVSLSSPGSTIRVCPGRYGGFGLSKDLTIIGSGDGEDDSSNTIIDEPSDENAVLVLAGVTATLEGLRITGGVAPQEGGGVNNSGHLSMKSCTVTDNQADGDGGGIYNSGSLTLTNCEVSDNSAGDGGGGILNDEHGALTMTNCLISDNLAQAAGGIFNLNSDTSALTIDSMTVICGNSGGQCQGPVVDEWSNCMSTCP